MITWKNCFRVCFSALILFLCAFYFRTVVVIATRILAALSPFFVGLIIAYLLNILMCFYERHYFKKFSNKKIVQKTKRPLCMIAAILSFASIIAAVIWLVIPELVSCVEYIIAEIPGVINNFLKSDWVAEHISPEILDELSKIKWEDYISQVASVLQSGVKNVFDIVVTAVTSVISGIISAFLGIVFAVYLLIFKERLLDGIKRILNTYLKRTTVEKTKHFFAVCNRSFHYFIVGQCTEAVILGILCAVGMFILKLPNAIMISTLIGFTALVPIAGAYIGGAIGALIILTYSPIKALIFIIFLVILQQLEGNLIYPKVVGDSIGLPSIFVLLAVTIGGGIAGIGGMLLGVPLAATFYKLLKERLAYREKRPFKRTANVKEKTNE